MEEKVFSIRRSKERGDWLVKEELWAGEGENEGRVWQGIEVFDSITDNKVIK